MRMTIELADQDYQYCLDYASGKTNIFALNNISRIIKTIADGTQYENHLKADMVTILDKIRAEIEKLQPNLRPEQMTDYDYAMVDVVNDIVAIIDKYKAESEE